MTPKMKNAFFKMHFIFFLKTKLKILFFPKISRISTHICSTKEINDFINECIIDTNNMGHNFFLI